MSKKVLTQHKLRHIPVLKVDPQLAKARFRRGCAMSNCIGKCCLGGVWLDPLEERRILAHADRVRMYMDSTQETDSNRWFDEDKPDDADFPSGRARGTTIVHGACVFLNTDKRCVLQLASNEQTGCLKPFFCNAFPIALDNGALCLDEGKDTACCTETSDGSMTVFELCSEELNYVLGDDGVHELLDKTEPSKPA